MAALTLFVSVASILLAVPSFVLGYQELSRQRSVAGATGTPVGSSDAWTSTSSRSAIPVAPSPPERRSAPVPPPAHRPPPTYWPPPTAGPSPTPETPWRPIGLGPPASLGRRLLSYLFDLYSASLLGLLLAVPIEEDGASTTMVWMAWLAMFGLYVWMMARNGRSLGKYVFGLRAISDRGDAGDLTVGRVIGRSLLALPLGFLGPLSILLDERRRSWPDRASSIRVIRLS